MTYPPPATGPSGSEPPAPSGKQNNWMGIVALITSLVCFLQGLGLIFGILGLRAAKRGEATNRGMSLFAVWWSTAWLILTIAGVAWFASDPDARTRDLIRPFGAAGADVAAIDEAIHEVQDGGGVVVNIGWDGDNYLVGDVVVPAESANPQINYYTRGDGHCIEIVNSSTGASSQASLSHGATCTGTPQQVLLP